MVRDELHISPGFLSKINEIIEAQHQQSYRVVLYPTLDDLYQDKVYKLIENEKTYFIPLWISELVYDISGGGEMIISCVPILEDDERIEIDENNHIHINQTFRICEIFDSSMVKIQICSSCTVSIPPSQLNLVKKQIVCLENMGISIPNTTDIYNNHTKSNVFLHITLE
jgi:hypothetical protein